MEKKGKVSPEERTPPAEFTVLRFGENRYTKDGKEHSFNFGAGEADAVIAEFNSRGRDLVIDFEHSTLSGGEAPAAGWIGALERTGITVARCLPTCAPVFMFPPQLPLLSEEDSSWMIL